MANTKSAKKNAKKSQKRTLINAARKSQIKSSIKKVLTALAEGKDKEAVTQMLRDVEIKIARAKGKGLMHKNTAQRKIHRLAQRVSKQYQEKAA